MRLRAFIPLALAAIAPLAACDDRHPTVFGSFGGGSIAGAGFGFGGSAPFGFVVSPNLVRMTVGEQVQLVASVRDTLWGHFQWRSLDRRVARVTDDGVVTAIGVGRATIIAQLTADTNVVAPATIFVSGVFIPGVVIP